ncbi:MAG TPA: LuxR C-terminal-related transcriptional regulator [Methylocella sp.]|nr:LuxR C-terminal-related transcriptional regulator [Methylocella sp.]
MDQERRGTNATLFIGGDAMNVELIDQIYEGAFGMASETLASLGIPALVLNEQGKVLAANSAIEALGGYVCWRAGNRVSLKDKAADGLLRDAIEAIDAPGITPRSFPVRSAEEEAMMVAHIIPIRLSAGDIFVRCAAALVLMPVTVPQAPPVELVQSLFDLTPAEARVARSLAAGETIDTIASARGVTRNTIRTHVRNVLEKTGCHRQAEIVALLAAISPVRLTWRDGQEGGRTPASPA